MKKHILANLNKLAAEICKREKSSGREVNITDVKRVLRHLGDIIMEEWRLNFGVSIVNAIRRAATKRVNYRVFALYEKRKHRPIEDEIADYERGKK